MRRTLLVLAAVLTAAACSDEGPRSGPGTLTATLRSPNGAEGAAHLMLVGPSLGAVTSVGDTEAHAAAGVDETRVVLVHPVGGELSFRVAVPDTTQPPSFVLWEVAGPDDALRPSLAGYALEFSR